MIELHSGLGDAIAVHYGLARSTCSSSMGDRSCEGAKQDPDMFAKDVTHFSLVVFHDTTWDILPSAASGYPNMGLPCFIDELRQGGYQVITLDRDCGLSIVQPIIGGIALHQHRNHLYWLIRAVAVTWRGQCLKQPKHV